MKLCPYIVDGNERWQERRVEVMHVMKCLVSNLQYQSTKRCFKGTIIQL